MHPWIAEQVTREHRRDLMLAAHRYHQDRARARQAVVGRRVAFQNWLGGLLIRVGCTLVARTVTPSALRSDGILPAIASMDTSRSEISCS